MRAMRTEAVVKGLVKSVVSLAVHCFSNSDTAATAAGDNDYESNKASQS